MGKYRYSIFLPSKGFKRKVSGIIDLLLCGAITDATSLDAGLDATQVLVVLDVDAEFLVLSVFLCTGAVHQPLTVKGKLLVMNISVKMNGVC